jgi:hypothetical protein
VVHLGWDFKLDANTAQMSNDAACFLLVGLIVAVAMLFAIFFFPILVFVGWVLVVSLVMLIAAWRVRGGSHAAAHDNYRGGLNSTWCTSPSRTA